MSFPLTSFKLLSDSPENSCGFERGFCLGFFALFLRFIGSLAKPF